MPTHCNLVDADLHVVGYVQAGDPGAIGAGKCWVDTSGGAGAWLLKIRNAANDGWEITMPKATALQIYNADRTAYITWRCRNNADGQSELYAAD